MPSNNPVGETSHPRFSVEPSYAGTSDVFIYFQRSGGLEVLSSEEATSLAAAILKALAVKK